MKRIKRFDRICFRLDNPELSQKRKEFSRCRAQAKFRNITWDLTFEQWDQLWGEHYHNKGRANDNHVMVRKDLSQGWTISNTTVQVRLDWLIHTKTKKPGESK